MPALFINDPEHWRARARDMRALSTLAQDEQAKSTMLKVAEDYELLARRAANRLNGDPQSEIYGPSAFSPFGTVPR